LEAVVGRVLIRIEIARRLAHWTTPSNKWGDVVSEEKVGHGMEDIVEKGSLS
jgi:hypothetical protein